jgi:hypothetical protein
MRFGLRLIRRGAVLALPCWIVAAPVVVSAQHAAECRHLAMHQTMHRGGPEQAPCWCDDMAGTTAVFAPEAPALPAIQIVLPDHATPGSAPLPSRTDSPPASPSYAPTPPPPNGLRG